MLPQFIMMRSMGLYDTLWAMVVLQAFSAFGVYRIVLGIVVLAYFAIFG